MASWDFFFRCCFDAGSMFRYLVVGFFLWVGEFARLERVLELWRARRKKRWTLTLAREFTRGCTRLRARLRAHARRRQRCSSPFF